jgi:hypothetical protein
LQERTAQLHKLGITSVHDFRIMGDENGGKALRAFQQLHAQNALKMRVCAMLAGEYVEEAARIGVQSGFGDDTLVAGRHQALFGRGARSAHGLDAGALRQQRRNRDAAHADA